MNNTIVAEVAKTVRCLAMDAIQKANSGHPGMPLGCAELGALLYGEFMRYDADKPDWLNRDRFVLSAGHGSMFLYALLHLAGYPVSLDDIRKFRQLGAKCAGHPEYGMIPGIETTTGPLGQGVANAVGLALAQSMMAARYNTAEHSLFDNYTWTLAGDGCLQEGVAAEAASLAGHLRLGRLIAFYDDNKITIDGNTDLAFTEDVAGRFAAYGWQVLKGDMYDLDGLRALVAQAKAETGKPSLIMLRSVIGKGAPTLQGSAKTHGAPLGAEEIARAKAAMGVPETSQFWVSDQAVAFFAELRKQHGQVRREWEARFAAWQAANPEKARELQAALAGTAPLAVQWPDFSGSVPQATRNASGKVLQSVATAWPQLVGGSADLTGPNVSALPGSPYTPANPAGRMVHFGVREHGMAAICNGLALYGGLRPFCATFLVFADYLRPALRLAALMKLPVIYILTHDSVFIGEDGPTHQPVEHLASLRAIPNVRVLRPADAEETVAAWEMAMRRLDGPTVLALTRQNLPLLAKADPDWRETFKTGAYVVRTTKDEPDTVILASGSEVSLAIKAAEATLTKSVRVVSVPALDQFLKQPADLRDILLPKDARVVGCEAGLAYGWEGLTDAFLGIDHFGESGPGDEVAAHVGLTVDRLKALL